MVPKSLKELRGLLDAVLRFCSSLFEKLQVTECRIFIQIENFMCQVENLHESDRLGFHHANTQLRLGLRILCVYICNEFSCHVYLIVWGVHKPQEGHWDLGLGPDSGLGSLWSNTRTWKIAKCKAMLCIKNPTNSAAAWQPTKTHLHKTSGTTVILNDLPCCQNCVNCEMSGGYLQEIAWVWESTSDKRNFFNQW